jgi:ligand-binding sensor domain-containing protein
MIKRLSVFVFILLLLATCNENDNTHDPIVVKECPFIHYNKTDGFIGDYTNAILVDTEGNVWVGTSSGLSKFDGQNWTNYTTSNGLIDNNVTAIVLGADGSLWIGTHLGISNFKNNEWIHYTTEDGLLYPKVYSLYSTESHLYIGLRNNTFSTFDGENFTNYTVNESSTDLLGHIHSITTDIMGSIWVGSCYNGLSKFDGEDWTRSINNINSFAQAIMTTTSGDIWAADPWGALYKYSNNEWTYFSPTEVGVGSQIVSLAEDINGNIWCGGNSLSFLKNDIWININNLNSSCNAIASDAEGNVWVNNKVEVTMICKDYIDTLP